MAEQDKYMNNTRYLIKTRKPDTNRKPCRFQLNISKTQKLSDVINTALTEVHCIKTRKADIKTLRLTNSTYLLSLSTFVLTIPLT